MAGTATAGAVGYDGDDSDLVEMLDAELTPGGQGDKATAGATPEPGADSQAPGTHNGRPPIVVKAADGVHEVPFSVLRDMRKREKEALNEAESLRAELERWKAGGAQAPADSDPGQFADGVTDEELEILEETDPLVAKSIREARAAAERVRELERKLAEQARREEQAPAETDPDAEIDQELQDSLDVQSAIRVTPELAYIWDMAAKDPAIRELMDEAIELDQLFEKMPSWAGKSYAERFAAVAKELQAAHPDLVVPDEYLSGRPAAGSREETPAAKAERILREAESRRPVPTSLSELPGGRTPESGARRFDQMSEIEMLDLALEMPDAEFDKFMREFRRT